MSLLPQFVARHDLRFEPFLIDLFHNVFDAELLIVGYVLTGFAEANQFVMLEVYGTPMELENHIYKLRATVTVTCDVTAELSAEIPSWR